MRRIGLYLLVALILPLFGGEYNEISSADAGKSAALSFCTEGKTWNYTFYYLDVEGTHNEPYSYVVQGDTVIGGMAYKKIYHHKDDTKRLAFMMREEGSKVYKRLPDQEEFLFFDFGREDVGQVYSWEYQGSFFANWMIYAIDEIQVNNNLFRRYCCYQQISKTKTIETGEDQPYPVVKDYWVEGIGSARYGIEAMNLIVKERLPGSTEYFISCYENGECIFTADDFKKPAYTTDDQDDYIPFVKEGKTWHMVGSKGDECSMIKYMLMNGEVVKDGKTYFRLYEKGGEVVHDLGLLREENHKVYFLDRNNILYSNMNEEFLLFDYSLKEGDIFETYSYDEHKMVSYKVMSTGDYLAGPEIIRYDYDEASGSTITHRRYLREWTVWRTDNKYEKRWIEGIGPYEGPLKNLYDAHPISYFVYLAYVNDGSGDLYLPFSFHDSLWRLASGCNLPTGEEDHSGNDNHHQLKYELEGDRLHVYGKVFTQCGPNNYAYFIRDPENMFEESSIRKFHFEIQEVEPLADCMALHATDFYVEGFSPNYDYIIIDNQGEEHPVQATGIEEVRNKQQELGSSIYNLQGQKLKTAPLKGIYIQNGKKVVVK